MPSDVIPILAAICLLSAFVVAARAAMAWRAVDDASERVLEMGAQLEEGRDRWRDAFGDFRGKLTDANASVEHGLWALAGLDERSQALERSLRDRRAEIDNFRLRYVDRAEHGLRRARATLRLIRQLIELRRTFLG